jgi:hypothetical protein
VRGIRGDVRAVSLCGSHDSDRVVSYTAGYGLGPDIGRFSCAVRHADPRGEKAAQIHDDYDQGDDKWGDERELEDRLSFRAPVHTLPWYPLAFPLEVGGMLP